MNHCQQAFAAQSGLSEYEEAQETPSSNFIDELAIQESRTDTIPDIERMTPTFRDERAARQTTARRLATLAPSFPIRTLLPYGFALVEVSHLQ